MWKYIIHWHRGHDPIRSTTWASQQFLSPAGVFAAWNCACNRDNSFRNLFTQTDSYKFKSRQQKKREQMYSLWRWSGVSLDVSIPSKRRRNPATPVLIWKIPAATACEGLWARDEDGLPPFWTSWKLIFSYSRKAELSCQLSSAILSLSVSPRRSQWQRRILHCAVCTEIAECSNPL